MAGDGAAPRLEMRGIGKSFLGTVVLDGVDLTCAAGEVHAVVGENGAGKSTLMKVLAGVHSPDAGEIVIDGEPRTFHHPVQAQDAGVAIIYQEFNLLPERTVAENVWVGREPGRFGARRPRPHARRHAAPARRAGRAVVRAPHAGRGRCPWRSSRWSRSSRPARSTPASS